MRETNPRSQAGFRRFASQHQPTSAWTSLDCTRAWALVSDLLFSIGEQYPSWRNIVLLERTKTSHFASRPGIVLVGLGFTTPRHPRWRAGRVDSVDTFSPTFETAPARSVGLRNTHPNPGGSMKPPVKRRTLTTGSSRTRRKRPTACPEDSSEKPFSVGSGVR